MADTIFKNCNGLDEEGHLTSAYDVAVMSRELMKHKKNLRLYEDLDRLCAGRPNAAGQYEQAHQVVSGDHRPENRYNRPGGKLHQCNRRARRRAADCGGAGRCEHKGPVFHRFHPVGLRLCQLVRRYATGAPREALAPIPVLNGMSEQVETTVTADGVMLIPKGKDAEIQYQISVGENPDRSR